MPSSYRRSRLLEPASLIPWSDPDSPSFPNPSRRRSFAGPRRVRALGRCPPPRFTLANERTFLAWIRTALALVAAGVALEAFALPLQPALRFTASMILLALGFVVPTLAWFTWTSVERALRESAPLPSSKIALPLAIGVSIVAALLVASVLLR